MNHLNGYTPGAMGRISFGTPSEGARMSEIEFPEPQWWYTDDSQAAMNMGFGLPEEKPLYTAEQVRAAVRAERRMIVAMQAAWKTQLVEAGLPDGVAAKVVEETCDRIAAAIRRG